MNRSAILVALVAAVASFACDSESSGNGSGGSVGSGGSGASAAGGQGGVADPCSGPDACSHDECSFTPLAEGVCINEADLSTIQPLNFDLEWNKCVPGCLTNVDCNTACFVENTGMSEPCSRCFSEMVSCWILSCASACPNGGGSAECFACVEEACVPDYQACFGTLLCPYEYACGDHFDNDGNGLVDLDDPTCQ